MHIEIHRPKDVVFPQGLARSISGVMGRTFDKWLHAIIRFAAGYAFYGKKADRDDALEIAVEVADRISERQKQDEHYVDGKAPIDKLIRTMVKRRLIERHRKQEGTLKKETEWHGESLSSTDRFSGPEWERRSNELIAIVVTELLKMPEKRRDAFVLVDKGLSPKDAAKAMGIKLDLFNYHLRCSLRDLKRALKGEGVFTEEVEIVIGQAKEAR